MHRSIGRIFIAKITPHGAHVSGQYRPRGLASGITLSSIKLVPNAGVAIVQ